MAYSAIDGLGLPKRQGGQRCLQGENSDPPPLRGAFLLDRINRSDSFHGYTLLEID